ncbi:hypothetical protein GPECTOR_794g18 [Gonium pectorale]|uniref:CCHC-type domain-containing protein n=1 Tax=Gonium pectorale TaxID=33097 RepID=A0A150FU04_GONPE|nr:hypothetical protein GPECTOR_794g18 [Gonium pectorale]|eukprot:KXZ41103.1 hypothetical protein GPECTOR_794g18 [Gonium pectorale]
MRALFDVASWGSSDAYRRLHLANAFEGEVRVWYDEWSLSRPSFTSDELVDNLLLTYAPMIRSAEQEARMKLTSKSYAMRADRDEPAAPPAKKAKVARQAACQAAAASAAPRGGARAGGPTGKPRKHGGSGAGKGKRAAPPSDPASDEYKAYYARLKCFGCGQMGHKHEHCPAPTRPFPGKGQGKAAAAAVAGTDIEWDAPE